MVAPVDKPVLPDPTATATPTAPTGPATGAVQPGAIQPDAMKPQAAKKAAKPIQKTKPTRRLQPGDLICGDCGEGNPPARKFCSRCGATLAEAQVVKKKWWQKLIPKRKTKTLEVGQRPGVGGVKGGKKRDFSVVMRTIRTVGGIAAVLIGLAFTFVQPFREWSQDNVIEPIECRWNDFRNQNYDPLNISDVPQVIHVTNQADPLIAFDKLIGENTVPWTGTPDGTGDITFIARFAEPVDLDLLLFRNGDPDSFTNFSRAKEVTLTFRYADGRPQQNFGPLEIKDTPDLQEIELEQGGGVIEVEVVLSDLNVAPTNPVVAIEEIEFQSQSGGDCSREARDFRERCGSGLITTVEGCEVEPGATTVPPTTVPTP